MRWHLATLSQPSESTSSSLSSCEERESKEKTLAYGLRENPKKSFKLIDPELLDDGSIPQNRESDTESTRFRSKAEEVQAAKRPKLTEPTSAESIPELDPVSSWPNSFSSVEEIALCLMMLSRDSNGLGLSRTRLAPRENVSFRVSAKAAKPRVHECPFCDRVFGSGQALGGHKRSHFWPLGLSRVAGSGSKKTDGFGYGLIDLNLPAPVED
ncbi:hypothetical protein LguiB_034519 [Lonicera macranthoides]